MGNYIQLQNGYNLVTKSYRMVTGANSRRPIGCSGGRRAFNQVEAIYSFHSYACILMHTLQLFNTLVLQLFSVVKCFNSLALQCGEVLSGLCNLHNGVLFVQFAQSDPVCAICTKPHACAPARLLVCAYALACLLVCPLAHVCVCACSCVCLPLPARVCACLCAHTRGRVSPVQSNG